jgi:CubicO group peptidase (beta-lactamase class C family)
MGYANLEDKTPISPDTNFRIGSVTKQFTAATVLKLEEQGKLKVQNT